MPAVTLCLVIFIALLIWGLLFVGVQLLLITAEVVACQRRPNHGLRCSLDFESNSRDMARDEARDRARDYLLRIATLTGATQVSNYYVLDVGTNRFQLREGYISRLQLGTNGKRPYEQTCYFCPNNGMPRAEQIATALLMLKNNPALFDSWSARNGLAVKADGQRFAGLE